MCTHKTWRALHQHLNLINELPETIIFNLLPETIQLITSQKLTHFLVIFTVKTKFPPWCSFHPQQANI